MNPDFASKLLRIKVPLISAASLAAAGAPRAGGAALDEAEEETLQAQILSQRKTMTEASIVRIMKARKSLDLNTLVAEVLRQLAFRFEPTTVDIKKRIEDLIERDYLERDSALARRSGCPAALLVPRPFHFPHPRPHTFAPQARTSGCCPTARDAAPAPRFLAPDCGRPPAPFPRFSALYSPPFPGPHPFECRLYF